MLVTCTTPFQPPSLTTIPPELLLRIIAFLPSTSALVSLTQTSSGLRHFFSLHAPRICNTYILARFPLEASLLRSQIRDGWLVPTHSSVRREEAILAQKRSHRRDKAQPGLQAGIGGLDGDCEESNYPSPCLAPYGTDQTRLQFGLSSPGPLYLGFLEEYSRDIRIRGELAGFLAESPVEDNWNLESSRAEREFAWQISTYSVRPFLRKLDALVLDGYGEGIDFDAVPTAITPVKAKTSLGRTLLARTGLGRIYPFSGSGQTKGKRGMYGELLEQPGEKIVPKTRSHRGLGRDTTSAILLWNMEIGGMQGPVPSSPVSLSMGAPLLGERKEQKNKNMLRDIKEQARMVGKGVRLGLFASSERVMSFVRRRCFGKQKGFAMLK